MRLSTPRVLLSLCSLLAAPAFPALAQCDGSWTAPFGPSFEPYGMSLAANGDVLLGGMNYVYNGPGGLPYTTMARLNLTTGEWSGLGNSWDFATSFAVFSISELPGGDVFATGWFGPGNTGAARFNPVTRQWTRFGNDFAWVGEGFYSAQAHAVLPNGDVIVGGSFSAVGGVSTNYIARYNSGAGTWSPLGAGTDGTVMALKQLPSGDLIVGGTFSKAGNIATGGVARYNPTTGAWSALGPAAAPGTNALALTTSGDIIAGGPGKISRWNHTTQTWSTLGTITGNGGVINAVTVLPGGDILAGGDFTKVGNVSITGLARYNLSTGTWSAIGTGISGIVYSLLVLPNGDFLAGGSISTPTAGYPQRLLRCNPSTGVWSEVGSKAVNDSISKLAVAPNGDVLATGNFTKAGNVNANRIARYDPKTGTWSALGDGLPYITTLVAALPNGDVVAALNNSPARYLARYNTASGIWSTIGHFPSGSVSSIVVSPGGDLWVSGGFPSIDGVASTGVLRYNFNSGAWSTLPSAPSSIRAMVALPDGNFIGTTGNDLFRYDPATGVFSDLENNFNGNCNALATSADGKLWVAGTFNTIPGQLDDDHLASYDLTTGVWSRVRRTGMNMLGGATSLSIITGGDIVITGPIYTDSGGQLAGIARYRPATDRWSFFDGVSMTGSATACALPNGDLFVGSSSMKTPASRNVVTYFAHYTTGAAKVMNQLSPQSSCRNGSASFNVDVFGAAGTLTYQWRKDGAPIDAALNPSAITPTLNLTNIQSGGTYDCVVNSTCNTEISNPATLTVCASDLNCDTYVDDSDFQVFVVQYNILDCADPSMPSNCSADINQDGYVDDADFQQFIVAYNQLLCS